MVSAEELVPETAFVSSVALLQDTGIEFRKCSSRRLVYHLQTQIGPLRSSQRADFFASRRIRQADSPYVEQSIRQTGADRQLHVDLVALAILSGEE